METTKRFHSNQLLKPICEMHGDDKKFSTQTKICEMHGDDKKIPLKPTFVKCMETTQTNYNL